MVVAVVVVVVVVKNYDDGDAEKPLLLLGCHVQRHAGKMDSGDGGGFSLWWWQW